MSVRRKSVFDRSKNVGDFVRAPENCERIIGKTRESKLEEEKGQGI